MTVKEIYENIDIQKVMKVIALNEISGNENVICKFSFAGGISGYSFGRSQFDVKHNEEARNFLRSRCGFTQSEIDKLLRLDKNIAPLNEKLKVHRKEIDEFDADHVKKMISHVASLEGLPTMDEKTFVHLVDYHNQFYLSRGGKMHKWLKSQKEVFSALILEFKIKNLKWGKEQPGDVARRWENIEKAYK
ncbi:hypothetical protein [Fusobacterium ulcerans]|uniref:hypothetical protein n=1 Tax=Fusobacterium ulcerans TaxID=861 RepID=UPI0026DC75DA|nr:hypothetical protein [Fusobacterium ulcerans]